MSRRILLIEGHPDPAPEHFNHALAEAYADGAMRAGHDVTRLKIGEMDFPLLRKAEDWMQAGGCPALEAARKAIERADHLVLIYPLWLGGMPALTRAFFEQVSAGGGMLDIDQATGRWEQKLKGKSARLIVTMGMPAAAFRYIFHAHSVKGFERNVLRLAGVRPVRASLIGMVEGRPAHRRAWLDRVMRLGRRGV